ncbi:TPA: hypothetical protein PXJ53_003326 [Yersinia enterocolitica]|uniref:hypothetical protein n=1 Tax=Yersinia enterocolitica TaxID=630 RepID=UPI0028B414DB|nr:hypothetical protein [Yersinia enterocolitica]EKN4808191.1 hypothetical protein [Yersinia enterocolitica]EKN5159032.1 hypothetical protein [Yersinia enterocolitica]EKN6235790.1 hypothetical protein [Yersinia enterocolitica]EKN6261762.1 hypothetical protein [Yersinia enterocolitica]
MTNLGLLKSHLALAEDYSEELLQVLQSAFDEITASRANLLELGGYSPAETADLLTGCGKLTQYITKFDRSDLHSVVSTALIGVLVAHQNQRTVLDQIVTLTCQGGEWTAQIALDEFPGHNSPVAAMDELSDWLIRLGLATKVSDSLRTQLEALWTEN